MSRKYNFLVRGFTLIELMVVIAIIGILTATALVNFGKNDDRDVRLEAGRLNTFIRDAQNKTLTGEYVSSAGKICGFGVSRDSSDAEGKTILAYYVETTGAEALNTPCSDDALVPKTFSDGIQIEIFRLGNGVSLNDMGTDIFFRSPYGEVYFPGLGVQPDVFNLTLTKGSITGAVSVYKSGRIN